MPPAGARVPGGRQGRGGQRAGASGLDTTEVREWARAQGIEVKDRGRIPAEVVARFKDGHREVGTSCCQAWAGGSRGIGGAGQVAPTGAVSFR